MMNVKALKAKAGKSLQNLFAANQFYRALQL
jgi:hypothetical protein